MYDIPYYGRFYYLWWVWYLNRNWSSNILKRIVKKERTHFIITFFTTTHFVIIYLIYALPCVCLVLILCTCIYWMITSHYNWRNITKDIFEACRIMLPEKLTWRYFFSHFAVGHFMAVSSLPYNYTAYNIKYAQNLYRWGPDEACNIISSIKLKANVFL